MISHEGHILYMRHVLYAQQFGHVHIAIVFSEPTKIVQRPENMRVLRGSDVRLECKEKHDVSLSITTTWMKNKALLTLSWR